MRIAILSDLHAFDSTIWKDDGAPSHYDISSAKPYTHCPIKSLHHLLDQRPVTADVLLCPGDLANRACASSLPRAWQAVNELGRKLKASLIAATVGNHDVDSRLKHSAHDPLNALKVLQPLFPIDDKTLRNQFWSDHFFVTTTEELQLVVLNSCAFHGTSAESERDHGRIDQKTLAEMKKSLTPHPINVVMVHHNPQKHSELLLGENDEIKGGQLLLDSISVTGIGNWLVVHGHKHHPKITYASGNASSAVVFSAGSAASTLYPELQEHTGNQFYVVEIDGSLNRRYGLVGRFESWDWHQGYGWLEPTLGKGLPASGGFGYRENPVVFAHRIISAMRSSGKTFLRNLDLYETFPEARYLIPPDITALAFALELNGAALEIDSRGDLIEVCIR